MPLVPWETPRALPDLSLRAELQRTSLPGPDEEAPDLLDTAAAAARLSSILASNENIIAGASDIMAIFGGGYSDGMNRAEYIPDFEDVKGFSPYSNPDALMGLAPEEYKLVSGVNSPDELKYAIRKIRREHKDQQTVAKGGIVGHLAAAAVAITDVPAIAAMMVPMAAPAAWGSRLMRVGTAVGAVAAVDSAAELAMHKNQYLRTLEQSMTTIGAGVFLGTAIGTWATRMPKSEFEKIAQDLQKGINAANEGKPYAPTSSAVGADAVKHYGTIEENTIAKGGKFLSRTIGRWFPVNILMNSSSNEVRILTQRMVNLPFWTEGNMAGKAGPGGVNSVESAIEKRTVAGLKKVVENYSSFYEKYAARTGKEAMSMREFGINVSSAMRRGDKSDITEVSGMARALREMFEEDRKAFVDLGVLPEELGTLGAESYFPRVYDHNAILANRPDFFNRIYTWARDNPLIPKETKDVTAARGRVGEVAGDSFVSVEEAIAKHVGAKEAAKKAVASLEAARKTRKANVAPVRALDREAEDIAQTLRELEDKRGFLAEEMSGASPESIARAEARVDRQIERARERGITIAEKRQKLADAGIAADESVAAFRTAAKEARLAAKEAKKAADAAKADARIVRDFEQSVSDAKTAYRDPAELASRVNETINKILGTMRANADIGHIGTPRTTKARTLDVPDHILEPYLVSDLDQVMRGYIRSVAPNIEMRKAFEGHIDLEIEKKQVEAAYNVLIDRNNPELLKKRAEELAKTLERAGGVLPEAQLAEMRTEIERLKKAIKNPKALQKEAKRLSEELSKVNKNLEGMRLRLLNQVGPKGNEAIGWVRTGRILRAYNYGRMLGMQTVSSLADLGHVVSKYGLINTGKALAKFTFNLSHNKLTRADSKRMHVAVEWMLDTRAKTLADISEDLSGGQRGFAANLERISQRATQQYTRLTLMSSWNSMIRNITSVLEQDAIIRGAINPSKLSKVQRAKLAHTGLSDSDLNIIAEQFAKHGDTEDDVFRAATELWDKNEGVQEVARKFESAIMEAGNVMTISRGAGDTALLMDRELMKTLLQFKTFGMVSVNRLMIPVAQGIAHGDMAAANGLGIMLALGALSQNMKDRIAGREPETDPVKIVGDALTWSGALGYFPDVWDPMTTFLPDPLRSMRFSRFKDNRPLDTIMGPSFGTAADFMAMMSGIMAPESDESMAPGISASDWHRMRKMAPFQNYAPIYRAVNAAEGEVAEFFGAEGATNDTFLNRLTESKPAK